MDSKSFQKGVRSFGQVIGPFVLLFTLSACDPVTWYNNEALLTSKVTNEHEVSQPNLRAKVRLFRFASQTIVELEFVSFPKDRVSLAKSDLQVLSDGVPLVSSGFVDNFNEASVKKYKLEELQGTVPLATDKKIAAVFANTKSDDLELQLFGTSYKFKAAK